MLLRNELKNRIAVGEGKADLGPEQPGKNTGSLTWNDDEGSLTLEIKYTVCYNPVYGS